MKINMKIHHYLFMATLSFLITSCVPTKKYQELLQAQKQCEEENQNLKSSNRELEENYNELQASFENLQTEHNELKKNLKSLHDTHDQLNTAHNQLKESFDLLAANKSAQLNKSAEENRKLIDELEQAQLELQSKEDALRTLDMDITAKAKRLDELEKQLALRAARVEELESILARKDSAVAAIKRKVQDALLGFADEGLTIEQKNGKVYVSLDESLLFESGKFVVDARGREVLIKLSKVLEQNVDINIVVEGHTDNVPYNGKGDLQDNWDLSVKRATSVVKILVNNSEVDPKRLTAAGRSKYLPIDSGNTPEARKKNRRTEIILTPKLDELFEILEMN